MTSPKRRNRRQPPGRAPAFTDGRDITEVLGPRAGWDATPTTWGGASDIGLPPAVSPADDYRQAIARANAEPGNPPGSGYHSGIGAGTAWHPGQYPPDPAPPAMLRARPPAPDMFPALQPPSTPVAPVGYEVTGRETGRGWPHLFELRCDYPAALAATPIPCDGIHRDSGALSFRELRQSAQAAGWHMDACGRWACPRCCQASPEYRGLYPVTVYDPLAAEAYVVGDMAGERAYRANAECFLRVRTLLHHASSHKRGRHADELETR